MAAGDYVSLKARLLPPSHAALPGGYDFARDAFFAGVGAVGSTLGPIKVLPPPADACLRQRFSAAIDHPQPARGPGRDDHRRRRRRDRRRHGDGKARLPLERRQGPHPRGRHLPHHHHLRRADDAGRRHFFRRRATPAGASTTLALNYPIKKWAAAVAMAGSLLYDVATGSRVGTERALVMTLIVLGAVIMDRRALTMRNLAFAVLAVVALEPEAMLGVSFQLSFAAVAALVAVMEARLAGLDSDPDPYLPKRGVAPPGFFADFFTSRSRFSSPPPAPPARPPRSWPITSTISAPTC